MQFQVPQFIEVEDKIFGPLTFKQFVYLAGGVGLSVVLFILLPRFISILLIAVVLAVSAALAFYKVNKRPFSYMLESAIKYITGGKLYIWKKEMKKLEPKKKEDGAKGEDPLEGLYVPHLSDSKLKDLAWSLDVQENKKQENI